MVPFLKISLLAPVPSDSIAGFPPKPILNVKNITYFKYYIADLYYFRFIFVSLQQF
nr:MAG TPA: hypothetical protein [Caudoviricetes sp.]